MRRSKSHVKSQMRSRRHTRRITHRDLKPANIKITPDGKVKVLDFGQARINNNEAPSNSPTVVTASGSSWIVGTPAYMSPEQARGTEIDRTSDVWAFGCVLYEMLSGTRPFKGQTVAETLAEVLKANVDWNALPAGTPESVRRLLRRCPAKGAPDASS